MTRFYIIYQLSLIIMAHSREKLPLGSLHFARDITLRISTEERRKPTDIVHPACHEYEDASNHGTMLPAP